MRVVVPVQAYEGEASVIASVKEAKGFALLELSEGMEIEQIAFIESFGDHFFDYIVVVDKSEDIDEAYDLGARALLARDGMRIEEIVEAMMFRELDEIQ